MPQVRVKYHKTQKPQTLDEELTSLAASINAHSEQVWRAGRKALEHAISAGTLLLEAQARVPHGTWGQWILDYVLVHPTTAYRWMRIARYADEVLASDAQGVEEALTAIAANPWHGRKRIDDEAKRQMIEMAVHHGMSLDAIAEMFGVARSTVWYWTSNNHRSTYNAKRKSRAKERQKREREVTIVRAVRMHGGFAAESYAKLRQALQAAQYARGDARNNHERHYFDTAIASMHAAEDALLTALGIEHGQN